MVKSYETVFILTPVLSEEQMKEVVGKYNKFITEHGGEIVHEDRWGLRKLAYPIQKKKNGFYSLFEYKSKGDLIAKLELEFKRDERVLRFLTVSLDKHAIDYNDRKRRGLIGRNRLEKAAETTVTE
ncbi:MAG: 30S ribosomal protein S6 [Bacteroidota bacterium]